jgi:hypothetical protein
LQFLELMVNKFDSFKRSAKSNADISFPAVLESGR